jgi:hypothetical protein
MVLWVHALIEAVVFHAPVLAGLIKRYRAIGATYRTTEGLRAVVHVAQFVEKQPRIAATNVTSDPKRAEGLAKRAEAVGTLGKRPTIGIRLAGFDHP